MRSQREIMEIAERKLEGAEQLFQIGLFEDAYYLAGYHLELLLKARICQITSIDAFFDENAKWLRKIQFSQTFKTHDIGALLILAGMYPRFIQFMAGEAIAFNDEHPLSVWNAKSRYLRSKDPSEVAHFLKLVRKIGIWIKETLHED